jgi:hypothetical protein
MLSQIAPIIERLSADPVAGGLLFGEVVATVLVGVGIVLETPENPSLRQKIAIALVIVGIIAETVCSVWLFDHDGSIIQEQQGKIVALEGRLQKEGAARTAMLEQLMPRSITRAQAQVLKEAVKGKTGTIYVFIHCGDEAQEFGAELETALGVAGYVAKTAIANPLGSGLSVCWDKFGGLGVPVESGVMLLASPPAGEKPLTDALQQGLLKARINVAGATFPPSPKISLHPAIFVGLKPPPFQQFPEIFLRPGETLPSRPPAWNPK